MLPIVTPRLLLRPWEERDRAPFAAMSADPEVMRFFPALLAPDEASAVIDRQMLRQAADGFCFFALERRADGAFLGFTGLATLRFQVPFAPPGARVVETGWRLARHAWGQGYAAEAARAAVAWGFDRLGLPEIVAFAVPANLRSLAVMARIGMRPDPAGDFDHPAVPADWPHRRHVLWRIRPGELTDRGP